MGDDFLGKAVSIECDPKLGVFQGVIKNISESEITIIRAFRNGIPLKKQDAEVTLRSTDILNIYVIPSFNGQNSVVSTDIKKPTIVKQPSFANAGKNALALSHNKDVFEKDHSSSLPNSTFPKAEDSIGELTNKISNVKVDSSKYRSAQNLESRVFESGKVPCNTTVKEFFGNLLPPKVEARLGSTQFPPSPKSMNVYDVDNFDITSTMCDQPSTSSKPIDIKVKRNTYGISVFPTAPDIPGCGNGNGNGKLRYVNNGSSINGSGRKQRKQLRKDGNMKYSQTFSTSVDDPLLHEDFDFEGNLALFNKQAIWDTIEAEQKPDLVRQTSGAMKKYRHDENILVSEPVRLRQIENIFDGSTDFVTDEGLIIPTIPSFVREKIESLAEKKGLSLPRQLDILTRGVTDLAILLLGGARRLTPTNYHQWPIIVIICAKSGDLRNSNIGAATGRQMASHGLKVILYLDEENLDTKSKEIALFSATDNAIVYSVDELPSPDLVILSTNSNTLTSNIRKWLGENRASVLAVDPPPDGIKDVCIKYAILPILPLNGISSNNYGKLYLCNLGIPDTFYRDAGIKYKSPFGHKFVIPIHLKE
ncbi:enhancer of mRNA-decapping protein 3 [Anastrepha ludens]|uniref:enhancer of mRNA-decapping protein 3 n=1 Tax=Anastrepha ludens TaxID=28586 RepID=UPI0023B140D2|nr:enhancer of mRNA-decapping protein 3 [Anastrepha ludens]